ncbi:MAG TPA: hypothetical protein PKL96_12790 [Bacteroidales bacterium]|nr:hypothetical protein [Bacteroidales bacterium]
MNRILGTYMMYALPFMMEMEEAERRRKEKLKAFWVKWDNLQNLPRKKKKKVKKDLLWEYSILTWDPMKDMFSF